MSRADHILNESTKPNKNGATCQCCHEAGFDTDSPVYADHGMDYCLDCLRDRLGDKKAEQIAKTRPEVKGR